MAIGRVGVLMGGTSSEREISLRSGRAISGALRGLGYEVADIDVGADVCADIRRQRISVAFLALHGGTGEDGSIQGMLEVMGMPYTGSGVLASALAMDKPASKIVFEAHGLKVPAYGIVTPGRPCAMDKFPIVVKPAREGSSVGVSIANNAAELASALEVAMAFDGRAVVEQFITGAEVHIGIMGGHALGGVQVMPHEGFYSYENKYNAGRTDYIIPPRIDEAAYARAKAAAVAAHEALGCRGASRVDLMLDERGAPYVLEVNTIPGMTETSLLPKIAASAGMDFPALIDAIIKEAIR